MVRYKRFCDVCGKEIQSDDLYFEVSSGAIDFVDEIMDGTETNHDVCGEDCLHKEMEEYLKEAKKEPIYRWIFKVREKQN